VRFICLIGGVLGIVASCLTVSAQLSLADGTSRLAIPLTIAGHVLGTLLLGSVTVAWLLGHAYLTATKMTIAPLRHFSRLLLWAVGVRVLFLAAAVGIPLATGSIAGVPTLRALTSAWLLLALRIGVGLIAVGVFAFMVADCVKLRSTQSATGLLYFGSVLAYVGELSSQYLSLEFSWPM